jgi:hypothetical protein
MSDSDYEEPITDVVEQSQEILPIRTIQPVLLDDQESDEPELPDNVPLEADTADTAEQAREVGLDEEDYR